jgi:hypothetical protein
MNSSDTPPPPPPPPPETLHSTLPHHHTIESDDSAGDGPDLINDKPCRDDRLMWCSIDSAPVQIFEWSALIPE